MLNHLFKHTKIVALLTVSALIIISSCSKDEEPQQPQPTLTALSISEGEVGTAVTLTGTNFGAEATDAIVFFGTIEASITTISATQIVTAVPEGIDAGEVDVLVKVKSLETESIPFTVLAPITVSATDFSATIAENTAVNTVLGAVVATTNRGTMTYSLTSQSVSGALAINSSTGQLTISDASVFDYETVPVLDGTRRITATVSVANGTETATANVIVVVTNVDELFLGNFNFDIAENTAVGTTVGQVSATKQFSSAAPISYAVTSQTPAGAVSIDGNGILRVANASAFDFETHPTISVLITATYLSESRGAYTYITVNDVAEINVQALLDAGQTPKQIYDNDNSVLNLLYGKTYGGGVIASFNPATGIGLILSSYLPSGTATGYTFSEAVDAANNSTLGGFTDWRLPTRAEAEAMCVIQSTTAPNALPIGTSICWTSTVNGTSGHINGNQAFAFALTDNGSGCIGSQYYGMGILGAVKAVREYGRSAEQFMSTTTSVFAGSSTGCINGSSGSTTSFNKPYLGYVNGSSVYISDKYCGVRRLDLTSGAVSAASTLFVNESTFEYTDLEYSSDGNYLLMVYRDGDNGGGNVLSALATNTNSRINFSSSTLSLPGAIARDASGNIYVTEQRVVKKFSIDANGAGTLLATYGNAADPLGIDGSVASATFTQTMDVQVDASGNIYVADINSVRKINPTAGTVTTVASGFNGINSIGLTPNGNIIVADSGNRKIRLINTSGQVYTLVNALSSAPQGIIVHDNNTFYYTISNTIFKATIS